MRWKSLLLMGWGAGALMPDKLRRDPKVLELVCAFDMSGKPIAAVCHGGWIPISAAS
jgi:protease I